MEREERSLDKDEEQRRVMSPPHILYGAGSMNTHSATGPVLSPEAHPTSRPMTSPPSAFFARGGAFDDRSSRQHHGNEFHWPKDSAEGGEGTGGGGSGRQATDSGCSLEALRGDGSGSDLYFTLLPDDTVELSEGIEALLRGDSFETSEGDPASSEQQATSPVDLAPLACSPVPPALWLNHPGPGPSPRFMTAMQFSPLTSPMNTAGTPTAFQRNHSWAAQAVHEARPGLTASADDNYLSAFMMGPVDVVALDAPTASATLRKTKSADHPLLVGVKEEEEEVGNQDFSFMPIVWEHDTNAGKKGGKPPTGGARKRSRKADSDMPSGPPLLGGKAYSEHLPVERLALRPPRLGRKSESVCYSTSNDLDPPPPLKTRSISDDVTEAMLMLNRSCIDRNDDDEGGGKYDDESAYYTGDSDSVRFSDLDDEGDEEEGDEEEGDGDWPSSSSSSSVDFGGHNEMLVRVRLLGGKAKPEAVEAFESKDQDAAQKVEKGKVKKEQQQKKTKKEKKEKPVAAAGEADKRFTCDVCNKTLSSTRCLNRHKKLHTKGGPDGKPSAKSTPTPPVHKCEHEGFGKTFKTANALSLHATGVHGDSTNKPFKCPVSKCGQQFSLREQFHEHMMIHPANIRFVCSHKGCGRRFSFRHQLTLHERMHAGERPFMCTVAGCTKTFISEGKMRAHARAHDKPYACPHKGCDGRFGYSIDLRRHLEKKHEDDSSDDFGGPRTKPRKRGKKRRASTS